MNVFKTNKDEIEVISEEALEIKKEELPEEEILEMNGDIYFLIDHSSNRQIEEIEAKKLFKDKVYYTV
jgi:ABC-type Fe3+-hydroxamate transport system substrate-binding protein